MSSAIPPQPGTPRAAIAQAISKMWWVLLLRGVLLVILGMYALFTPLLTFASFIQVLAFFAIVDGVLAILTAIMGETESRGWLVARGFLCIVVGVFVAAYALPVGLLTAQVIAIVIAIQIIASGILEIMVGIRHRKEMEGEGWLIFGGILSILLGSLLLASPTMTARVLIRVAGCFTILFGGVLISNAFRARALGKRLSTAA